MDQRRGSREYLRALEEERIKIEIFQRELPLSLQLVNETIENLKKQTDKPEQPGYDLISINLNLSTSENEEEIQDESDKKKDWSPTLQLWNQESDVTQTTMDQGEKLNAVDTTRCTNTEAFHSVEEDDSSTKEREKKDNKSEDNRKSRRCWSPDLHRHFVQALDQLGGPHVATPKQIRDIMKVEGLTNDEVKSHLQKYRLHVKKPSSKMTDRDNSNNKSPTRAPQFVLVGAWVPPQDCTGSEDITGPTNIMYPSVVSLPSHLILTNQERKRHFNRSPRGPLEKRPTGDHHDGAAISNSSQTTNALPNLSL